VVVRNRRRRGEVAPVEFNCSLERVAPAVFGFSQRREFPGEQTLWFLLRRYLKYAEHPRRPAFLLRLFTLSTTLVFCSAGNLPPRGNPGLKSTRADDILKKFEFKLNFK
jgi:hypothetical protein